MSSKESNPGWSFWGRWLLASAGGWVVGLLGAILLSNLALNLVYSKETNLLVGLCTGAAVGSFQMVAARRWILLSRSWVWGAMAGMAIPYVAVVLVDEFGLGMGELPEGWLFGLTAVVGSVMGGFLQTRVLRPHTSRATWWVVATVVSWGLAWSLGLWGGVALGAVGGGVLIWLLRAPMASHAA